MTEFEHSKTKENLMRAFVGESQARNRYTFAAQEAKKQNLYVVEAIFRYTAEQEKEHAEIFYSHLQQSQSINIPVEGNYPIDLQSDALSLLRSAQHNEYEEYNDAYRAFGEQAKEEGFSKIAAQFRWIAEIEKIHGDRFGRIADWIENGMLFADEEETTWFCLNCGHIHRNKKAPAECPVCSHSQGYFIRWELSPYALR